MKRLAQFLFLILVSLFVWSGDLSAAGFEDGTLSGWTSGGGASVSGSSSNNLGGKAWVVNPYGTKMGMLYPNSSVTFDTALSALGLTATENSAVRSFLSSHSGGGSSNPTDAAYMKTTVALTAGVTYTFAWNYLSTDYTPYNDGSMITLTNSNGSIVPTLNNNAQRYALLGFTNPGSGNYATGSYGSTGWQIAVFTVPSDGNYDLGFAAFNLGDTVLSPILYIDEIQGTTTLNGQTFGPIAPNAGSNAPTAESVAPSLCCGGSSTSFNVDNTHLAHINTFVNRTTNDSKVNIEQIGSFNTITVTQTGTKNNYLDYYSVGHYNNITVTQSGNSNTQANYSEIKVGTSSNANYNTVNVTQQSTGGGKGSFVSIEGSNNSLLLSQKDSGSHYASVELIGGNKNVDVTQQGSGSHMAKVGLSGNPVDLSLTQSGSTQQYYSINYNCTTSGGCAKITVTQGQ